MFFSGMVMAYVCIQTYLVDVYEIYAASALAGMIAAQRDFVHIYHCKIPAIARVWDMHDICYTFQENNELLIHWHEVSRMGHQGYPREFNINCPTAQLSCETGSIDYRLPGWHFVRERRCRDLGLRC